MKTRKKTRKLTIANLASAPEKGENRFLETVSSDATNAIIGGSRFGIYQIDFNFTMMSDSDQ